MIIAAACLALAACASRRGPEPAVIEVARPVPTPCVPASLGEEPDYPDTDAALRAAPDAAAMLRLLGAGRLLREAWLAQVRPVLAGCVSE